MISIPGLEHLEKDGWEIVGFENVSQEELFIDSEGRIVQWAFLGRSIEKKMIVRKVLHPKPAKQSWTPKVGDWVKVTKPVDLAPAHKIWWVKAMNRFHGQVLQVTSVNPQSPWATLDGLSWDFDFAWLALAEDPRGQPAPTKRYRDPTQADLTNGPIECEVRDTNSQNWTKARLHSIDNIMNIDKKQIEAEYQDSNRSEAWLEASLLVGTLVLGLTVLYLCGALEWIVG